MDEDKKLYKEFLHGNKDSFEVIVDKYMEKLIYFINYFVKRIEVSEDLAQDVFVYILMNKEQYDFKYSLKTYLFTIAKSRAINYLKKEKRITYLQDNDYLFTEEEVEDVVFNKEKNKQIKRAIEKLPEPQNKLIYLVDIEELSYSEICKILDMSMPKVKSLIHRARKKLKIILQKEVNYFYE